MDILSHIPLLCEETDNGYIFVTSKDSLGAASSTKRPTSCVMIVPGGGKKAAAAKAKSGKEEVKGEDYMEEYQGVLKEVKELVSCERDAFWCGGGGFPAEKAGGIGLLTFFSFCLSFLIDCLQDEKVAFA